MPLDDHIGESAIAYPRPMRPAVAMMNQLLSGVIYSPPLRGSSWLPLDDPAMFCAQAHIGCTFIAHDDPLLRHKLSRLKASGVAVCISVDGPFGLFSRTYGLDVAMKLSVRDHTAFDAERDSALEATFSACEAGADVIVIADDIASSAGLLADPSCIDLYLLDVYRQMNENAKALGVPAIFHSDGDITAYYGGLAQAGISGVHIAIGPDERDIERAFVHATSHKLTPIGGIPVARLGSQAGIKEVSRHVRDLGALYPCIISDDGGLTTEVELEALAHVY